MVRNDTSTFLFRVGGTLGANDLAVVVRRTSRAADGIFIVMCGTTKILGCFRDDV